MAEHDLDPRAVAARLEEMGRRWVPMTEAEARAAMTPPPDDEPFEVGAARRLEELRRLDELTRYLHRAASPRDDEPAPR